MASAERDLLLHLLDQGFDQKAWHGPTLGGALRGISPAQAAWRPQPRRHNIWELAVHCAYWKYAVLRLLTGEARGSFPLAGSNWFARPTERTAKALAADLRLLSDLHRRLRAAVAAFPPSRLGARPATGKRTYRELIAGVAAHDLYHAGQVRLLEKLQAK